jgi:TRAP-type C4-dicarboxylate transport system permease small subunit
MKRFLSTTETIAAVFLLLIALLTSANVVMRNMFDLTLPDWFDFARLLLGIAMFWGISIATYRAGHICVDAVWELLNKANQRRMDVVASVLTLAFLVPLAWMVWVKVGSTGTQATSDLRLPMVYFYAVAACGAVVAAFLAALRVVEVARGHDPADDVKEESYGS